MSMPDDGLPDRSIVTAVFEVGEVYEARSVCDYECVWRFEVTARTAWFVTVRSCTRADETRRLRVTVWEGEEQVLPLGRYSMAPVLRASRRVVAR